jgi:hypothetical protein
MLFSASSLVHADDDSESEEQVEEEGFWKTYNEGNDLLRISTEAVYLQASQKSFFGLIKGEEHVFMVVAEINAKEFVEEEQTEEDEETNVERLGDDEYSDVGYSVITSIKDLEVSLGSEEDNWHAIIVYKFKHSVCTITYYHSLPLERAYLKIVLEYNSHYNVDKYDKGYLLFVDGEYVEQFCKENDEGNIREMEIEL